MQKPAENYTWKEEKMYFLCNRVTNNKIKMHYLLLWKEQNIGNKQNRLCATCAQGIMVSVNHRQ